MKSLSSEVNDLNHYKFEHSNYVKQQMYGWLCIILSKFAGKVGKINEKNIPVIISN
jgi:hypothetical protein